MAERKAVEVKNEKNARKSAGAIVTRGRTFQGVITKKFDKRAVVELERTIKMPKYERFAKSKTVLHARIPETMKINEGDTVKVRECRPLSKIIHFMVTDIVRRKE